LLNRTADEARNDTFAVLRVGSERGFGVAVTCGAGINCLAVATDGRTIRFPSLGSISGDWGGDDIGSEALYVAARSEDGRGPKSILELKVPEHFGFAAPIELARALYDGELGHEQLTELTPLVLTAAVRRQGRAAARGSRGEPPTGGRAALMALDRIGAGQDAKAHLRAAFA
jgi:N-acetylglucosamine kinase-like BadF-type ATPase